jgi:hypothetical protein
LPLSLNKTANFDQITYFNPMLFILNLNIYINPAELDKSLFAGIIYAKRIDNSATVTNK